MNDLLGKAAVLKKYEVYGYRIAFYILRNEALALRAVTQALVEIFSDDDFFLQSQKHQTQRTKQVCIKHSLQQGQNIQPNETVGAGS